LRNFLSISPKFEAAALDVANKHIHDKAQKLLETLRRVADKYKQCILPTGIQHANLKELLGSDEVKGMSGRLTALADASETIFLKQRYIASV